ncbi:MAG: NlpC/P60 family protein [Ruminococcaceae bacterium]|nr:NlpC/P60 family protein [Oscillospiraceae bacterium]
MKTTKRIASLVLAFFLFIAAAAPQANAAGGSIKTGIAFVNASSLRLRSSPSTSSTTLDYAYNDEVVILLGKTGSWYKVIYNLQTGYMHSDYLDVTTRENAELGYGRVNGSSVNIRSGPSTGYAAITKAKAGDKAYIIGINNQWLKIIYGDSIGYIRSDYLDLTEIPYENRDSQKSPLFFRGGKSTGVAPSASALNGGSQSASPTGQKIVNTAKQYIGVPYVWGGTSPKGFDCSGLVQYVFKAHGISLPRTTKQQWTVGASISKQQLKVGDLVFFANTYTSGISHVGIYVGNNQFIHASSSQGVIISSLSNTYWAAHYYGCRSII